VILSTLRKLVPVTATRSIGAQTRQFGARPRKSLLWNSREQFYADALLFVLGTAGAWSVGFIGAVPGCEVLLLPLLPALLLRYGRSAFRREYLWFYIAVGGWLIGTFIADAYNGIPLFNRAKGTARVVFFMLDFMGLAILINNKVRNVVVFTLSICALYILSSEQFAGEFLLQWKFGLSQCFAILALLLCSYFYTQRRYWICFLIGLMTAGINLHFGFRSQLVIILISTVLILPIFDPAGKRLGNVSGNHNTVRVLILIALAGGGAYASNAAIKYAAEKGVFDEASNEKFRTQSQGDYGVLVGGRPETLVAIQAIRDSPIFGHGSFPYGEKYVELKQDIMYEHGYTESDDPEVFDYPVIPTHSHLTLGWVEGGILGGLCWIYIFVLVCRSVLRLTATRPHLSPLYSYFLVNFLWDILYSPFGSVNRMRAAFYILLSFSILLDSPPVRARLPLEKTIRQGRKIVHLNRVARSSREFGIRRPGLERPGQV
jgi:hypothetical protein